MTEILDITARLAVAIRQSAEYKRYLELRERVRSVPQTKAILRRYRQVQFAVQLADMVGEDGADSEAAMDVLCALMEDDPVVNDYLTAEYNLSRLIQDIESVLTRDMEFFDGEELDDDDDSAGRYLN